MNNILRTLADSFQAGTPLGITSVCSAHASVIEAALRLSLETSRPALIEATCNQVNQDGGYTGMTPADFRDYVFEIADRVGVDREQILLGGDHLGPNPWKNLPADQAMAKAEVMIAEFAAAGFYKLHLDCSMGCLNEPETLADEVTAGRAAQLAAIAEKHRSGPEPVYIIGTEVPVPGGAAEELEEELEVTTPAAAQTTHAVHQKAFAELGISAAFDRVIALVVQPGVEFGHSDVHHFAPAAANELTASLAKLPGQVFEAHSTDYQTGESLAALVRGGFSILKVGPWLTFALREALYGLDAIADVMDGNPPRGTLMSEMERIMSEQPSQWDKYYTGTDTELWLQRHFSYSDRIRYYWPEPAARAAANKVLERLRGRTIPETLLSQYLPTISSNTADEVVVEAVLNVLRLYDAACHPSAQ